MAEIAGWFATYVYLPKLRDRVVLEKALGDALAKLDPKFAYADGFEETSGKYIGLIWQKAPVGPMPPGAVLVRPEAAMAQLRPVMPIPERGPSPTTPDGRPEPVPQFAPCPPPRQQPHRFFGTVEIDMVRPVKSFETILSAVLVELQRTKGAKVKVTLEIEADAEDGFSEADIGSGQRAAAQIQARIDRV